MTTKTLAVYERESTLWKNANGFYHAQDWCRMECIVCDFSDDLAPIKAGEFRFLDADGNDVTARETEQRYGKPYCIKLINKRRTNERCYWFKTAAEANEFFKAIMADKILGSFRKVR